MTIDPGQPIPRTLLPLSRYAQIMRIPLPHFWQQNGSKAPIVRGSGNDGCANSIWDQDARNDLAWTILQAEEMIADELGFWPAPKFITSEQIAFGLPGVRRDWLNAEIRTRYGYVQSYGAEQLTLVTNGANAQVAYSDSDGDPFGREELAVITDANGAALTACANACDVAVFFRVADGAEDAADDRWEIRPVKVDIDGATMRITAESSLFISPALLALTKADCEGSQANSKAWQYAWSTANLVTAVDVYCRTVNTQTPVTLRWDGVCDCTSPCSHNTQTACAYDTDNRRGHFIPRSATWNGSANVYATPTYSVPPESVLVNYRAGYPLDSRSCRMDSRLERAIVKLTNALLPEPPCGFCGEAETRWQDDRQSVDPLTPEAAGLPWDLYKRGALEAWRIVKLMARGRGGKAGRGYR